MPPHILDLGSVSIHDARRVGHKAAHLGHLCAAGFPVPAGLCLTTDAFRLALAPYERDLRPLLTDTPLRTPADAAATAGRIAALLQDLRLPGKVGDELRAALARSLDPATPLAVRSSATAEDRPNVSFAGQYQSALGVCDLAALEEAVLGCWRSFFSAHGLSARAAAGALAGDEAMAVLVQPMIDAECAGVCFTLDPQRPADRRLVIEAAWGLGPGIVDGSAETDTFQLSRRTLAVEARRIVEKTRSVRPAEGGGVEIASVPAERRRAACLPDAWVRRLGEFGLTIEQHMGRPQDIEWAIAGDRLWILQSRPITTLAESVLPPPFPVAWENPSDRRRLWRLDESAAAGPVPPLANEVEDLFSAARAEAAAINGKEHGSRRRRFNGWAYVTSVPTGMREGDQRVRRTIQQERGRRLWEAGTTSWEHRAPEVVPTVERLSRFDVGAADGAQLAEHAEDAFGAFRWHWCLHWQGVGGSFSRPYREALAWVSRRTGAEADRLAAQLLPGEETELTRLIDRLWALAQIAAAIPELRT